MSGRSCFLTLGRPQRARDLKGRPRTLEQHSDLHLWDPPGPVILSHRALASRAIALPASWANATHRLPGQATTALFKGRHMTQPWDVLPYLIPSASRASRAAHCDPASPHAQARSPTWTGHTRSEPAAFNSKCSDR